MKKIPLATIAPLSLTEVEKLAHNYSISLQRFVKHNLETVTFRPIDHFALKARDRKDYEEFIVNLLPFCDSMSYTYLNQRRLATAVLKHSITFPGFGKTFMLEIMEPRPEKVGQDYIGLEHVEVYSANLELAEKTLLNQKIDYEIGRNPHHTALVITINHKNQEIKFTNSRLEIITFQQKQNGQSIILK